MREVGSFKFSNGLFPAFGRRVRTANCVGKCRRQKARPQQRQKLVVQGSETASATNIHGEPPRFAEKYIARGSVARRSASWSNHVAERRATEDCKSANFPPQCVSVR